MILRQYYLTKNDAYMEARKIVPCGILWHSTGAPNPYLWRYVGPDDGYLGRNPNNNHWNRPGHRLCGHAMIGKQKDDTVAIYQTLPFDYRCMLSGSSTRGNANTMGWIQFEICEDSTYNADYAMEVYRAAVWYSAMVLKKFGLGAMSMENRHLLPVTLDHAEGYRYRIASNHGDVRHWFGKYGITMDKIRRDIAAEMGVLVSSGTELQSQIIRLEAGTPYYKEASNTSGIAGRIQIATNYTIIATQGVYGLLKSRAGWVQLKEDPKPDPVIVVPKMVDTWARQNTIRQGAKGKTVEALQLALTLKGYDPQAIDGDFGAKTDAQVRAFQRTNKLTVDGIVGRETWPVILK